MQELVISLPDYSFVPAANHDVNLDEKARNVTLIEQHTGTSTTFELVRVTESAEEKVVYVGNRLGDGKNGSYPVPPIQEETDRLRRLYIAEGGRETDFDAWATGEGYHEYQSQRRADIRRLRREKHHSG